MSADKQSQDPCLHSGKIKNKIKSHKKTLDRHKKPHRILFNFFNEVEKTNKIKQMIAGPILALQSREFVMNGCVYLCFDTRRSTWLKAL